MTEEGSLSKSSELSLFSRDAASPTELLHFVFLFGINPYLLSLRIHVPNCLMTPRPHVDFAIADLNFWYYWKVTQVGKKQM